MVSPINPLIQLAYCSLALPPFNEAEIQDILDVSRGRNRDHGITGVLLYKSGFIVQVLEGPPAAVRTLYANIARDPRHTEVHHLYEMPIAAREFPGWSMGFAYADFGFERPPESYNDMLHQFINVRSDPLRRGTSLLVSFASTTR